VSTTSSHRTYRADGEGSPWGFPLVCVCWGLAVLAALPPVATAAPRSPVVGCAPATLTATPVRGTAPLLVNFSLQVPSTTPPTYAWSFGDGTFYNGSGPLYASPVHRYTAPGSYNIQVVVNSSSGTSVCSTSVTATPAAFVAVARAQPTAGKAPLNVTFTAQILGGSGTYLSAVWWFDDGDNGSGLQVTYTFQTPGNFLVLLNVTDSAGHVAHGTVWVNVTSGSSSAGPGSLGPTFTVLGVPGWIVGTGGVLLLLAALGAYFVLRRSARPGRGSSPPTPTTPPGAIAERLPSTPPLAIAPLRSSPPSPVPPTGPEGLPAALHRTGASFDIPTEALRLSQRVIVHLAQQGALPDEAVATEAFTQGGMATALGVPQNRLSNVLRRLRDAGALREDVRHVSGRSRRMKVYRLTPLGERLAQDLRRRAKAAAGRSARPARIP
jgi:hypothetical protein